jgi:ActR/RegA family two-component response regulator
MHLKKPFTIFIVEDDPFYGMLLLRYLSEQASEVQLFQNSEDLLFELHRVPNVILLDYYLGESQTGLDVLKAIKEINPDIPVVFLTGQESIEVAVSTLKYGAFDYVEKNDDTFAKLDRVFQKIENIPRLLDDDNLGNGGLHDGFRKTFFRIFQLLFALLSLSSCASPRILMPESSAQQPANDRISNPSFGNYKHHIQIDDKLSTSVRGHDNLSIGSLFGIYNSNEVYGKWVLLGKDA